MLEKCPKKNKFVGYINTQCSYSSWIIGEPWAAFWSSCQEQKQELNPWIKAESAPWTAAGWTAVRAVWGSAPRTAAHPPLSQHFTILNITFIKNLKKSCAVKYILQRWNNIQLHYGTCRTVCSVYSDAQSLLNIYVWVINAASVCKWQRTDVIIRSHINQLLYTATHHSSILSWKSKCLWRGKSELYSACSIPNFPEGTSQRD